MNLKKRRDEIAQSIYYTDYENLCWRRKGVVDDNIKVEQEENELNN